MKYKTNYNNNTYRMLYNFLFSGGTNTAINSLSAVNTCIDSISK